MYSGHHMAYTLLWLFSKIGKMFTKNYFVKGDMNGYRVTVKWWIFERTIKKLPTLQSAMNHLRSITKP